MDYTQKFEQIKFGTLFNELTSSEKSSLTQLSHDHLFSQQELRQTIETAIDLRMWEAPKNLPLFWNDLKKSSPLKGREFKKWAFKKLGLYVTELKKDGIQFKTPPKLTKEFKQSKTKLEQNNQSLFGMCAVQSEKTACCNLRTIDAVKNCGFGCSYCSIQTLYKTDDVVFDSELPQKLKDIELDPQRKYHIGTGQSSDALMWGNHQGLLDHMMAFAKKWPNILLEFKTKSKKINYFLEHDIPKNIVCSWSLNPEAVIENEEHLTASLEERLSCAEKLVAKGIKVAFHLHPMVFYKGWEAHYTAMIQQVMARFEPKDVLFISFGTLTFPKPIMKKIRSYGINSKMLQIPMTKNPEGKLTYPDSVKEMLFNHGYQNFKDWHDKVFFYLCMEEKKFWDKCFGTRYASNNDFESALIESSWTKL